MNSAERWERCVSILLFVIASAIGATSASASTVLLLLTPEGIVIAEDGLIVSGSAAGGDVRGKETSSKIVTTQRRIAVASIALEGLKSESTGAVFYDFHRWFGSVDKSLPSRVSVTQLADTIAKTGPWSNSDINSLLASGEISQRNGVVTDGLAEFIVAGYEAGQPRVIDVSAKIDWGNRRVMPVDTHTVIPGPDDWGIKFWGRSVAISQLGDPNNKASILLRKRAPLEYNDFAGKKRLDLAHGRKLLRAMLELEIEADSDYVGLPITIVSIPHHGNAVVIRYHQFSNSESGHRQTKESH